MQQLQHKNLSNASFLPEIRKLLAEGKKVTLRAKGWSMRPFVEHERDLVQIAPCLPQSLRKGDVVLAQVQGGYYVIHRIVRLQGEALVLQGDGNVGTVEHCLRNEVLGKIEGFYRKGRKMPDLVTEKKWKMYSQIWCLLTPIRPYLLAFYRRIYLKCFPPL